MVVGLADRLDTLVGLFAVGIRPSGAADPWGLRRAALGLVQLLVGKEHLAGAARGARRWRPTLPVAVDDEALREVLDFVIKRYRGYLLDQRLPLRHGGRRAERARATTPTWPTARCRRSRPGWQRDDWDELLDNYARCVRITRDQAERYAVDA